MRRDEVSDEPVDVAIVGCGPVGGALAALLGRRGHRVLVRRAARRRPTRCPGPSTSTTRWPASSRPAGSATTCRRSPSRQTSYEWRNGAGAGAAALRRAPGRPVRLARLQHVLAAGPRAADRGGGRGAAHGRGPARRAARRPRPGHGDRRRALHRRRSSAPAAGADRPLEARYVVGCDGANSTVRDLVGATVTDLGFFYDWLIVDVALHEPRAFDPINLQVCDPAGRRPRCRAARAGGAGSSCACPARRSRSSTTRPGPGSCSRRGTSRPATPPSSATRSTGSRPAGPTAGGSATCCSPATPPTRCPRSPGRACARACATPPTWPGSSTSCCAGHAGPRPARRLRGRAASDNVRAVIDFSMALGKVICVTDPAEAAERDARWPPAPAARAQAPPPLPGIDRRRGPRRRPAGRAAVRPGPGAPAPDGPARACSTTSSAPGGAS